MPSPKIPKPSAIAATVERLAAIQTREEQLRRIVADTTLREPEARSEVLHAQRTLNQATASGLYDAPPEIVARLREAQTQLAEMLDRRGDAEQELKEIPALRIGAIRDSLPGAWVEYVGIKTHWIAAAEDAARRCEKMVNEYDAAATSYEDAKQALARVLKPLGVHAERVLSDCRRDHPEPIEAADADTRQTMRRAARLRQLYREDLRWP